MKIKTYLSGLLVFGAFLTIGVHEILNKTSYDNSINGTIISDSTRGSVKVQRGSADDTDSVLEIKNGLGVTNLSILGNGNLTGKDATLDNILLNNILELTPVATPTLDPGKRLLWLEETAPGDGQIIFWDGVRRRIIG